jgi:hypothetical protein
MPRPLQAPNRDRLSPEDVTAYNACVAHFGAESKLGEGVVKGAWIASLMQWPAYARHRAELSTLVRTAGLRKESYSHADREFVDVVLAPYLKTNVVMRSHIPDALAVGVRLEAIQALFDNRDEDLNDDERFLAVFVRQVVDGDLSDENWDRMEKRLGARGAAEYVIFITVLLETMRQMQAFKQPEMSNDEVQRMLADFREGRRKPPEDWRDRIA